MINREIPFGKNAIETIESAKNIALDMMSTAIFTEHLLLALAHNTEDTILKDIFSSIDRKSLLEKTKKQINKMTLLKEKKYDIEFDQELINAIGIAKNFVYSNKIQHIQNEHLLYAISALKNSTSCKILNDVNLTEKVILEIIKEKRDNDNTNEKNEENEALYKYCINLSAMAKENKLDPVIGREKELRSLELILYSYKKSNPILIGEPGVGKTSIVELLAQAMQSTENKLDIDADIYSLDIGLLMAGTKYRGELEDRVKKVINAIKAKDGKAILFIDEIHTIIDAGSSDGNSSIIANILKPTLVESSTFKCIGATTINEFKKIFEKDGAIERRFRPIQISEPSVDDTIAMLRGRKEALEKHHKGIIITDESLVSAAKLSSIYITNRYLPDKAIDLVDQAASMIRVGINRQPEEMERLNNNILQMKIEHTALLKEEQTKQTMERLETLDKKIKECELKYNDLKDSWEQERKVLSEMDEIQTKIEKANIDFSSAKSEGNLSKASEILYGILPNLKNKLKSIQDSNTTNMLRKTVTKKDIAKILTQWTGIPTEHIIEDERQKLINMEEILQRSIVGQNHAIKAISNAIKRSRVGISNKDKPIGSFLLLGSTGVGKTELAKTISEFLFNSKKNMIRIDMSEYMEKHSITNLIGSTPGFIGYERGGLLTEIIRHKPYQVVLLDEIEKAHPDVLNLLLQILDDGHITDGQGREINFKNTIIIMTSNLLTNDEIKTDIRKYLTKFLKAEFINRIDEIVSFNELSEKNIEKITKIQTDKLVKTIKDNVGINVVISDEANKKISEIGFDKDYGARPIKRAIQDILQNKIASLILENNIKGGDSLYIGIRDNDFEFKINNNTIKQ